MNPSTTALLRALSMFPMTCGQIEKFLGKKGALVALRELRRFKLLTVTTFDVGNIARIEVEPLYSTVTGQTQHTARELAQATRDRYGDDYSPTEVFSVGEVKKSGQLQHELGLASVFITMRRTRPDWTVQIPKRGEGPLDLDMVMTAPSGVRVGIDYLGEYRQERIREILSAVDGTHVELY